MLLRYLSEMRDLGRSQGIIRARLRHGQVQSKLPCAGVWEGTNQAMEAIQIAGAEIYYDDRFLLPEEATGFFNALLNNCAWERRRTSFGHAVPRDEAYYGDPGTDYTYSRREYKPLRWIPELLSLKTRAEEAAGIGKRNFGVVQGFRLDSGD